MKLIHKALPLPGLPHIRHYFKESAAFFDIETTGFSAGSAFVYLIGMAYREGDDMHVCQFLARDRFDEAKVINCFYQKICQASTIITFNGNGFDLPFIKKREQALGIANDWDCFSYADLYQTAQRLSKCLQLPNKKQKTIERFLGIEREDRYGGGELISVYLEYEKQNMQSKELPQGSGSAAELEELLLLHNYEDVTGMLQLLSLLSYQDFLSSPVRIKKAFMQRAEETPPRPDLAASESLVLVLQPPMHFPKQVFCRIPSCSLTFGEDDAILRVNAVCGEMRYYYDNYKDYYYLPEEDMAIHKNVAIYADPSRRKKATKATCYTRRTGVFLPQDLPLFTPCFYPGPKTKTSYFEFTEEFLSDTDALCAYAAHLLSKF